MHRALLLAFLLVITACSKKTATNKQMDGSGSDPSNDLATHSTADTLQAYTDIRLHDVQLEESAGISLTVSWLRGRLYPAQKGVTPSLDNPQSFTLEVQDGLISVALSDVAKLLNTRVLKGSSLSDVKLSQRGDQLQINGTLHKILPVQVLTSLGVSQDGQQIMLHIAKLEILKMPVGGLLKVFDVKPAELIDAKQTKGIQVSGNDVAIDTAALLPPPRNTGKLKSVQLTSNGQMVEVYGSPGAELSRFEQYRNFIRLRGGTINIGKLTMAHTDILIVDTSQSDVFTINLAHFPEQLVNGYARLTPLAGLQIFLPDIGKIPNTQANQQIDIQWVKNRNIAPPPDIP
jgi:hypothetical protein